MNNIQLQRSIDKYKDAIIKDVYEDMQVLVKENVISPETANRKKKCLEDKLYITFEEMTTINNVLDALGFHRVHQFFQTPIWCTIQKRALDIVRSSDEVHVLH